MEVVSAFPLPPPYYKKANLQPPALPTTADQSLTVFGEALCTHISLETTSIAEFIAQISNALAEANSSFKALVRLLVEGKASSAGIQQHLQSIREAFLTTHSAINEQRKIEALSKIITSLKGRIEAKRQMIDHIDWKIQHESNEIFAEYSQIPPPPLPPFQGQTFDQAMHQRIQKALINAQE